MTTPTVELCAWCLDPHNPSPTSHPRGQLEHLAGPAPADCPFCGLIKGGQIERQFPEAVVFEPLNPVTPGHRLVVPRSHVADATEAPSITAETMRVAALVAREVGDCNIITSVGGAATQTVFHLHIHIVPRRAGDGLTLPWTGQNRA